MPKKKSEGWKPVEDMPVGEWVRVKLHFKDAHGAEVCVEAVNTGTAIVWGGGIVNRSTILGWNKIKVKAKKEVDGDNI